MRRIFACRAAFYFLRTMQMSHGDVVRIRHVRGMYSKNAAQLYIALQATALFAACDMKVAYCDIYGILLEMCCRLRKK